MSLPRLVAVIAVVAVLALPVPAPTNAWSTDAEVSRQNTLHGGTHDITLSEVGAGTEGSTTDEQQQNSISQTWVDLNHDPTSGDNDPVNNTVRINTSTSSIGADRVNVTVDFSESDGSLGTAGNPDNTARTLVVDTLEYKSVGLIGVEVVDENGNGHVDIDDLTLGNTSTNLTHLDGIAVGSTADLHLVIDGKRSLLSGVGEDDGLTIRVTIRGESPTFVDPDTSTNNTIRYAS